MADDIRLEPLGPSEFDRFSGWFHGESVDLLLNSPQSVNSLFGDSTRLLAWQAVQNEQPVAIITVSVDGSRYGHLNFVVNPGARRQGVGSSTVRLLVEESEIKQLRGLLASVNPANTGAQKILIKNGFARVGFDSEGFIEFKR